MICSVRYTAIHDIMPTKQRLHRIALTNTDRCDKCGQIDTLIHRVTDCGAGKDIWNWTQALLAMMLNKRPQHIHADWILRPYFHTTPLQKHGAILWILAHLVYYRTQCDTQISLQDYADFLGRARWKAQNKDTHKNNLGTICR